MHARVYEVVSSCMHGGTFSPHPVLVALLNRLGWMTRRTNQAFGLLDRIPGRGECGKVNRCDIYILYQSFLIPFISLYTHMQHGSNRYGWKSVYNNQSVVVFFLFWFWILLNCGLSEHAKPPYPLPVCICVEYK